jgi:zinc protease
MPSLARRAHRAVAALGLCAIAFFSATVFAQPYTTPPPPAPPRPLAIAAPSEARLANGLRVIVARREGVPLVSAELVALAGTEIDTPRLTGLAYLGELLLTQGTKRHSAPELAAAAEALGGSLDSGAGWNSATVSITVTTPKLDAALALMAEVAREPMFAADEIERVRTQTLDELKVAYASPGTLATLVAERLAYGVGPYGHPANGTPESLPRITRDDLVAVHRRTFRPDNAALILAGDITAEAGLALARSHLGSWVAPGEPLPTPPRAIGASAADQCRRRSGQSTGRGVVVALPLPDVTDSERDGRRLPARSCIGQLLAPEPEIRIKRGLSYGAGSVIEGAPSRAAFFHIGVQTKNESRPRSCGSMQEGDRSHDGSRSRRGARRAQAHADRRLQPQRRDDAGAHRRRRALVVANRPRRAEDPHRRDRGSDGRRHPALCGGAPRRGSAAHRRGRRGERFRPGAQGGAARRRHGRPGRA